MVERGAKIILIRPAPVLGLRGRARSPCPSSTRSGSGWSRTRTSSSSCTPPTAATPATPTSGRAPDARCRPFAEPHALPAVVRDAPPRHRGHRHLADLPRRLLARSRTSGSRSVENGSGWVPPLLEHLEDAYTQDAPGLPGEAGPRRSSATSTCTRSTRRTPRAGRSCSAPTTSSSGPTTRTSRAWPTRSPTSTSSTGLPDEDVAQGHGRQHDGPARDRRQGLTRRDDGRSGTTPAGRSLPPFDLLYDTFAA